MDAIIHPAPFTFDPFPFINCFVRDEELSATAAAATTPPPIASPEDSQSTGTLGKMMAEYVLFDTAEQPQLQPQQQYNAVAVRAGILDAAETQTLQEYGKSLSDAKEQHHCVWEAHLRRVPDNFVPMRDICDWLQRNVEESDDDSHILTIHEMWLRFCFWRKAFCTRSRFGNLVSNAVKGPYCKFRNWTPVGRGAKHCHCQARWMHVHGIRWSATAFPTPSTEMLEEQMLRVLSDRRFSLTEEVAEHKHEFSRAMSPPKKSAKRSPQSTRRRPPSTTIVFPVAQQQQQQSVAGNVFR